MGLFSFVFSKRYPTHEEYLSEVEIKRHINNAVINTLSEAQENLIQASLIARRRGDGKLSLQQAYEVLTGLVRTSQISKYDRDNVMKALQKLFATK